VRNTLQAHQILARLEYREARQADCRFQARVREGAIMLAQFFSFGDKRENFVSFSHHFYLGSNDGSVGSGSAKSGA
jgi:hypothetical protein